MSSIPVGWRGQGVTVEKVEATVPYPRGRVLRDSIPTFFSHDQNSRKAFPEEGKATETTPCPNGGNVWKTHMDWPGDSNAYGRSLTVLVPRGRTASPRHSAHSEPREWNRLKASTSGCTAVVKEGVAESEEAERHSLPAQTFLYDPEILEIALLLKRWVPLALGPAAEQKENETQDFPPGPLPREGAVRSPSPVEQSPPPLGPPSQEHFLAFFLEGLAA
ncbi:hypothetical protein DPX16_10943 [Anabarilius grahami]|uniref:Uncharacterized protein n=1 Tax=Anabarilius grahami TaxID=495550 RepID=A0A3N0Y9N0_ANAGA|nr:hypothetical protein DPX16_10943 [Anabarilius grahami]